jgi:hypothetical protein
MAENGKPENQGEEKNEESQGHQVDKGLQRLQQKQANTDKALQEVLSQLNTLTTTFEEKNKPEDPKPSDDIPDVKDDDVVDAKTLKAVLGSVKEDLKGEVSQVLDALKASQQVSRVEKFWQKWEKDHSQVAGKRDDFFTQAQEEISDLYPDFAPNEKDAAIQLRFDQIVKEEEGKISSKSKNDPDPNPPKDTKGTKIKPDGASDTKQSGEGSGEGDIPDLWIPDDPQV